MKGARRRWKREGRGRDDNESRRGRVRMAWQDEGRQEKVEGRN